MCFQTGLGQIALFLANILLEKQNFVVYFINNSLRLNYEQIVPTSDHVNKVLE